MSDIVRFNWEAIKRTTNSREDAVLLLKGIAGLRPLSNKELKLYRKIYLQPKDSYLEHPKMFFSKNYGSDTFYATLEIMSLRNYADNSLFGSKAVPMAWLSGVPQDWVTKNPLIFYSNNRVYPKW